MLVSTRGSSDIRCRANNHDRWTAECGLSWKQASRANTATCLEQIQPWCWCPRHAQTGRRCAARSRRSSGANLLAACAAWMALPSCCPASRRRHRRSAAAVLPLTRLLHPAHPAICNRHTCLTCHAQSCFSLYTGASIRCPSVHQSECPVCTDGAQRPVARTAAAGLPGGRAARHARLQRFPGRCGESHAAAGRRLPDMDGGVWSGRMFAVMSAARCWRASACWNAAPIRVPSQP